MIMDAPGRFSITTGLLQSSASLAATTRAVVSIEPPGAVGTMMRTARSGKPCARAAGGAPRIATATNRPPAAATGRRRLVMGLMGLLPSLRVIPALPCRDRSANHVL